MNKIETLVEYALLLMITQMLLTPSPQALFLKWICQITGIAIQLAELFLKLYVYGICQYFGYPKFRFQIAFFILMATGVMADHSFFQHCEPYSFNMYFRVISLLQLLPLLRLLMKLRELDKIARNIWFSVKLMQNIIMVLVMVIVFYGSLGSIFFEELK